MTDYYKTFHYTDREMKKTFEGLGLEAISFQRNLKLHTLMTAHMDIIRGTTNVPDMLIVLGKMEVDIYALTGMRIKVLTHNDPSHDNMIVTFQAFTRTHPLMSKMSTLLAANPNSDFKVLDIERTLNGGVNLETGMVYGDFSKIISTVFIATSYLNNRTLSSGELSAMFIHELGHVHNYFEFLGQTFITNYLLHESSRIWLGNYPKEKRVQLLSGIEKQNSTKIANKELLAESGDINIVHAIIDNSTVNKVRSEMGSAFYDRRSLEFLADQFAIRHGVGRDLVTGQDKFHRSKLWLFRDSAFRSTSSMVVANLIKITMIITANTPGMIIGRGVLGGIHTATGIGAAQQLISTALVSVTELGFDFACGVGGTWLMQLFSDKGDNLYDKPADRFAATRREMVIDLKTKGLDKVYVERILEDIKVVDDIIAKLNGLGMLDKMLYDYVIDVFKGRHDEVKLQQQYEKLSNNNLFQHAAKLSTLDAK
jgi:hypothetical protein